MTDGPRYATLHDYLRVLRRSKWMIAAAVVLFGVGAWALTARDKPVYRAETSLTFQDVNLQTGDLLNQAVVPTGQAQLREQLDAATITRPSIVALVAKELPNVPRSTLTSGVGAAVQTSNTFLIIQVEAHNAQFAQTLANAYAQAVQTEEQNYARAEFSNAATRLEQLIRDRPAIGRNAIAATTYQERIANLQFDAQTAVPVTIATNATAPTNPVFPHPVRDAVLGVLLGLTLGVILAFARDALDRRLRGTRQILEELDWPILAHIKEDTLGRAGFVAVNGDRPMSDADLEGFRTLRQNIQFLNVDEPPRSIVVTSAKPEEGKSTVAASLACASALTGKQTLLIDCDLRRPSLAKKLGVSNEPGLVDYLLGEASAEEILRVIPLGLPTSSNGKARSDGDDSVPNHVAGSQLGFIPAGKQTTYLSELLSSDRLRSFLAQLFAANELVVIDSSPVLPVADALELMAETQGTLLCVRASKTTDSELRAVKQAIGQLPSRPAGIVLTGVRSGSEADFGYYAYKRPYA
jgi:Mrp family chromosome partitioning ATPase/LPS O-antigen subunit length determinant protein (WzzB/FepE family)